MDGNPLDCTELNLIKIDTIWFRNLCSPRDEISGGLYFFDKYNNHTTDTVIQINISREKMTYVNYTRIENIEST